MLKFKLIKPSRLLIQTILVLGSANVVAQDYQQDNNDKQRDTNALEIITVVGQATNSVVTSEQLDAYQANDLADVFRLNPSISVGGSVGVAQKIYVRGIEDSLINVTVDGAPQTSTLFHHIGRVSVDPNLLKQVEVQAGAGEATSGAGSIGGAIRFKTKEAKDLLSDNQSFGGKAKASYFSNEGSQYSASLYGRINENWGALAYFNNIDRDNFEDGNGDEVFGTSADQTLGFIKLSGDITENQSLALSYERRNEKGEFSARPNWVVQEGDPLYESQALRDTAVVNYNFSHGNLINLEASAYQTESSYRGGRFDYLAEISSVGFDIRNTSKLGEHKFTYGVDYRDDKVESGFAIPQPEEDHAEEGSVLGVYAQGYSSLSEALLLSYGLRYDDYQYQQQILLAEYYGTPIEDIPSEISNSDLSINAGLAYQINDRLTFGLGYAEAARGKEIGDGFTIDAYLYDRTDAAVVDPSLSNENVSNVEMSLEYASTNLSAKIAVFDSTINDVIFERLYGNSLYENIGDLETDGIELALSYQWENIEMSFGYSKTGAELSPAVGLYNANYDSVPLNGYEFIGLGNSRGDTINVALNFTPTENTSFGFNISHVSSLTIDALHQDLDLGFVSELYSLNKPSYTTVDAFAEWTIKDGLVLNLAATNLLDELYRDHSSVGDFSEVPDYDLVVGPWEAGRDFRVSLSYSF